MAVMRVMQAAVHKITDMVTMRHGFVPAARAVNVVGIVPEGVGGHRRASRRVVGGYLDHMLVDMVAMRMMQVAVMQVVDVIAVLDRCMATAWAMLVRMIGVLGVRAGHGLSPS